MLAEQIVSFGRNREKLTKFSDHGIDVRVGDYVDRASMVQAFSNVDKLLKVPGHAFQQREIQHQNIVSAAKEAGVKHIVYIAIQRKKGSKHIIPEVTESDLLTEQALPHSGAAHTILYNGAWPDFITTYIETKAAETGVRALAGNGKNSSTLRRDLAETNAVVLTQDGHEGKKYILGATEAGSFADMDAELVVIHGRSAPYTVISDEEYLGYFAAAGFPPSLDHSSLAGPKRSPVESLLI